VLLLRKSKYYPGQRSHGLEEGQESSPASSGNYKGLIPNPIQLIYEIPVHPERNYIDTGHETALISPVGSPIPIGEPILD
jgi:hypothetical protein